jgi:hypothetical protein
MARSMEEIIRSEAGQRACLDATARGLPALQGVDRLLRDEIGDYDPKAAGRIVAELMHELGYRRRDGRAQRIRDPDCIARSGIVWLVEPPTRLAAGGR